MKKLFAVLIAAGAMISCSNRETNTTSTTTDSVTAAESPLMDAVSTRDSASKIIQDSIHPDMDTIIKK